MFDLKKVFHPEIFQGINKTKNYFEGWYYKMISKDTQNAIAIIPGVSMDKYGVNPHAFVQVLTSDNQVYYFRFDIREFSYNDKKFEIMIGDNYFSNDKVILKLKNNKVRIQGQLRFRNIIKWPSSILRPNVMGVYSYFPCMECNHGVVSVGHDIFGSIDISGATIDFNHGYGYTEKNWGRSFPKAWIWVQSNHFYNNEVSFMFSAALVPMLLGNMKGFVSFLRIMDEFYLFATYTGAKIPRLEYDNKKLKIRIVDYQYVLDMIIEPSSGGSIKGANNGAMNRNITESLDSIVKVRLSDRKGYIIYEGTGQNTGVEIAENLSIL